MGRYCEQCGRKLGDEEKYCPGCGTLIKERADEDHSYDVEKSDVKIVAKEPAEAGGRKGSGIWKWIIIGAGIIVLAIIAIIIINADNGRKNDPNENTPTSSSTVVKTINHIDRDTPEINNIIIENEKDVIDYAPEISSAIGLNNALSNLKSFKTFNIGSERYYKMQQLYKGYPVYKTYVTVVVSDSGEIIDVSTDAEEIPEDISTAPAVNEDSVIKKIKKYAAKNWESYEYLEIPGVNDDSLVIYKTEAGTYELAYLLNVICDEEYEFVIGALNGQIYEVNSTINNLTGETVDGTSGIPVYFDNNKNVYVLGDEDKEIYVFDLDKYSSKKNDFGSKAKYIISEDDLIFGNTENERKVDYNKAVTLLTNVESLTNYYVKVLGGKVPYNNIYLFCNDGYDFGRNAFGGICESDSGEVGFLSVGHKYSCNETDVIAHEYTHIVASEFGAATGSRTDKGITEGIADTMSCLYRGNWDIDLSVSFGKNRNAADPKKYGYPDHITNSLPPFEDESHWYATVISHAAYLMYESGYFKISDLGRLWYKAIARLPGNCTYLDLRDCLLMAGKASNITRSQADSIIEAFNNVGISGENKIQFKDEVTDTTTESTAAEMTAAETIDYSDIIDAIQGEWKYRLAGGRYLKIDGINISEITIETINYTVVSEDSWVYQVEEFDSDRGKGYKLLNISEGISSDNRAEIWVYADNMHNLERHDFFSGKDNFNENCIYYHQNIPTPRVDRNISNAAKAYLSELINNENDIRRAGSLAANHNATEEDQNYSVSFADITGDGVDEMFYVYAAGNSDQVCCRIVSCQDGKMVNITNEDGDDLWIAGAANGTRAALFTSGENNHLFSKSGTVAGYTYDHVSEYDYKDGMLKVIHVYEYGANGAGFKTTTIDGINNEEDVVINALKECFTSVNNVLIGNINFFRIKPREDLLLSEDFNIYKSAMTYDEAIDYLREVAENNNNSASTETSVASDGNNETEIDLTGVFWLNILNPTRVYSFYDDGTINEHVYRSDVTPIWTGTYSLKGNELTVTDNGNAVSARLIITTLDDLRGTDYPAEYDELIKPGEYFLHLKSSAATGPFSDKEMCLVRVDSLIDPGFDLKARNTSQNSTEKETANHASAAETLFSKIAGKRLANHAGAGIISDVMELYENAYTVRMNEVSGNRL